MTLLAIEGLTIGFQGDGGTATVVEDLDLTLDAGNVLGLVGESGCGKSVTARSIMRLLDTPPARYPSGRIRFAGADLLALDEAALRQLRGNRMAMIFQEPMTSLNPTYTVGWQLDEALRLHTTLDAAARRARARELFGQVGIGAVDRRLGQYPHELSGGLRQRVMIAMAIACRPALLIADEPTTALDVTVQAQILDLLLDLRDTTGMAILLITHDLGVVAESCNEVAVMYAGRIVERAAVEPLFARPRHPYTAGLMASIPKLSSGHGRLPTIAGTVPPPGTRPSGCSFADRCGRRLARCATDRPRLAGEADHQVACWNPAA
jgi:peptide/nickel transport system ATP-binding protein/oligopeptide transport system ATP-binding protein